MKFNLKKVLTISITTTVLVVVFSVYLTYPESEEVEEVTIETRTEDLLETDADKEDQRLDKLKEILTSETEEETDTERIEEITEMLQSGESSSEKDIERISEILSPN